LKKVKKGYRKARYKRPVEKDVVKGYDSNWEYELHSGILEAWSFHVDKVPYTVDHKYEPDFVREIDGKKILLEAKGRFWDFAEYSKYVWISKVLPDDIELVFLFANPSAPMPQATRRKDGTKRSHGEWASSKGFRWFSEDSIPDSWINTDKRETFDD
jgi:hypothetical protein|tara:strand:+ start:2034 stop:2504 length:471 start_codon:yes stop_codon:yes gene_type:complete